ncbi:MAG TPA: DUF4287 domain-containing protein [Saprospiraceae bacterium]|nr:DUF4287 domain-containing protein [Saprospiraceae bacterium]HMQ83018.1 DUF4287 domain-containing protein [Saprospiraceae bacterium]
MSTLFEEQAPFIENLNATTGKTLTEWFDLIDQSQLVKFLDIRKWLMLIHQLETAPATIIAQLYLENVEINAPKVFFYNEGRGGSFTYQSNEGSFNGYWEFGGGDALALLFFPSESQWEAQTKLPLKQRQWIMDFVGQQAVKQQTTSGRGSYEMEGDVMVLRS